jgi:hypothetical protein
LRKDVPQVAISPRSGETAMQASILHLIFKTFNTLGGYITENI